jgi:hypothetical protein
VSEARQPKWRGRPSLGRKYPIDADFLAPREGRGRQATMRYGAGQAYMLEA